MSVASSPSGPCRCRPYGIQDILLNILIDVVLIAALVFVFAKLEKYRKVLMGIVLLAVFALSGLNIVMSLSITAGHSYGLPDGKMLWKYALKNSIGTTATDVALSMGYTLTDTFLVEAIFSWPGIGSYISGAVTSLDYPAIIGVTLFGACCYIILNLLADIIIASDPRVRL